MEVPENPSHGQDYRFQRYTSNNRHTKLIDLMNYFFHPTTLKMILSHYQPIKHHKYDAT